jgi:hypothetical protein
VLEHLVPEETKTVDELISSETLFERRTSIKKLTLKTAAISFLPKVKAFNLKRF